MPFLRIDQDKLEENLATTEKGGVANVEYSLEDAQKVIAARPSKASVAAARSQKAGACSGRHAVSMRMTF